MDSEITDIIVPSIFFFIAFFMAFTLIEMVVILILNRYIYKNWAFIIDVVIRAKVHYGNTIERLMRAFVIVFLALMISFTLVLDILKHASFGVKVLAVEMLLIMILIYLRTTRKIPKLSFMKAIHKYLYIYLSAIFYVLTIVVVNDHYPAYQKYINDAIVNPVSANSSEYIESRKRKKLLTEFRHQIYADECPRTDLRTDQNNGKNKHFVYVTTHTDLKLIEKPINPKDQKAFLTGRLCSNSEETFLLTDYGQWYWVIEE